VFVDNVEIEVTAGDGGNGAVTFRREKYVPHGGPSGGDGGKGGDILFEVDTNLSTLLEFRYQRHYKAQRGGDGQSKDMFGKDAPSLLLKTPPGTAIYDAETGELIADLTLTNSKAIVAHGGHGGRGNTHFANSVQQAPKFAEKGEPGENKKLRLELKLLADVGLLGYPSVGKSTLISAVSAARPKIADYPFTTLIPNLGVVSIDMHKSFVMADLPGLIEGANLGVGLGHQFLRHVERTRVLVHILDVSGLSGRDPLADYRIICKELALYQENMADLPQIVALNKIDVAADHDMIEQVRQKLMEEGRRVFLISAATRMGLEPLLYAIWEELEKARMATVETDEPGVTIIKAEPREDLRQWNARHEPTGEWVVEGKGIEKLVAMTDLANSYAVRRLQKTLERIHFNERLRTLGVEDGDTIRIGKAEFDFEDEYKEENYQYGRRRKGQKRKDEES
jgi:GTP-binding protein